MRAATVAILLLAACGADESGPRVKTFGGDRPADLQTPATLTEGKQYPLIVLLHGYGASGFVQTAYFHLRTLLDADAALFIAPDGTTDAGGKQFWNADPDCCDFANTGVDDVAYLGGLVDDIVAEWPVDKNEVFFLGHSNGGYMSYRMACERADAISAIVSLAGNAASVPANCNPSRPVSVLHMHGTADTTVPYTGGTTFGSVGAVASVEQWASHDGCGTTRSATVTLDLDTTVGGAETHGETTADCPTKTSVDLWTLEGSTHLPIFDQPVATTLLDWMVAHKR
jgi:polyhydroxybutyrate depolymerase